jgi:hypothetical protein
MSDASSIPWAAGLFEGEGTIVVRPDRGSIQVVLYGSDEDVVRRFARTIGLGKVFGPLMRSKQDGSPAKDMWEWRAYSSNARQALEMILPHLGKRRTAKAIEALSMKPQRQRQSKHQESLS